MVILKKILPIAALLGILVMAGFLYADGYQYPPCCDTAVSLIKAKEIARYGIIGTVSPLNPSEHQPLYSSVVSSESLIHLILAGFYKIHPAFAYSLSFAKIFFLILFVSTGFGIFLVAKKVIKNSWASVITVLFSLFSFWYGSMYWLGHVAQMLGILVLSVFLYFLILHEENLRKRDFILSCLFLILSFFTHVLTFLIALLIFITYFFILIYKHLRVKTLIVLFYGLFMLCLLLFFILMPHDSSLLPNFQVTDLGSGIQQIFQNTIGQIIFAVVFVVGFFGVIYKKKYLVIIFFLSTFFLSQSANLSIPFYSYRFNEFIILPIILISTYGLFLLIQNIRFRMIGILLSIFCMILLVPYGISQQLEIRKCYIRNCSGLNPTQISTEEVNALKWVRASLPARSVFSSAKKFGYYIPVVTDNTVEFPDGEKEQIFTNPDPLERFSTAHKYYIRYILWSDIFQEMDQMVVGAEGYSDKPFSDSTYFKKIYNSAGVTIYEVQ